MTAWPTRLMRVHWKLFAASSESVIFQLFWRIDEKPSCLQSQWLMKPALGQSKEEEEEEEALGQSKEEEDWQDQTTHYLPPSLSGNWGKKNGFYQCRGKKNYFRLPMILQVNHPNSVLIFYKLEIIKGEPFPILNPPPTKRATLPPPAATLQSVEGGLGSPARPEDKW